MAVDILLVEDDRSIAEGLTAILAEEGYSAVCAKNGADAWHFLQTHPRPRLMLLDLMMPVMNGWELRQKMLADDKLRDIPLAILSGAADAQAEAPGLQTTNCFCKPFDIVALLGFVEQVVHGSRERATPH